MATCSNGLVLWNHHHHCRIRQNHDILQIHKPAASGSPASSPSLSSTRSRKHCFCHHRFLAPRASTPSSSSSCVPEDQSPFIEDLVIPAEWTSQASATQESEWLNVTLRQWLDDEFCPEPANEEISRRCSKVYYYCLVEKQLDMGDILMQMVRELETFSFKDSFHGAFSSANAAVDLIVKKICAAEAKI